MILILLAFLLDNILSNYLPYNISYLTWFQPCFFVVIIVFLYYYIKNKKRFLKQGILYIIIGSLIFGNNLLLRLCSFWFIFLFLNFINKKYHFNVNIFLFSLVISLFIYFSITYLMAFIFNKTIISFVSFIWMFLHYLLFNIIFGMLLYFFGINRKVY